MRSWKIRLGRPFWLGKNAVSRMPSLAGTKQAVAGGVLHSRFRRCAARGTETATLGAANTPTLDGVAVVAARVAVEVVPDEEEMEAETAISLLPLPLRCLPVKSHTVEEDSLAVGRTVVMMVTMVAVVAGPIAGTNKFHPATVRPAVLTFLIGNATALS